MERTGGEGIELWFSHRIVCPCFTTSTQHTVTMAPLGFYCFRNVVSACPSPPRPSPPCRSAMFNILIIVALSALLAGKVSSSAAQSPHLTPPIIHPTFHHPPTSHSPTPPPTPPPTLRPSSWTGDRFAAMRLCTAPLLCSSLGLPGTGSWSGTRPPSSWPSTSATSSS